MKPGGIVGAATDVVVTNGTKTGVDGVVLGLQENKRRAADGSEMKSKRYGEKFTATLYGRKKTLQVPPDRETDNPLTHTEYNHLHDRISPFPRSDKILL
jgi:hypothetical protein